MLTLRSVGEEPARGHLEQFSYACESSGVARGQSSWLKSGEGTTCIYEAGADAFWFMPLRFSVSKNRTESRSQIR